MDHNTQVFLRQIEDFFSENFSRFKYYESENQKKPCAYYFNYKMYKLSIVTILPLSKNEAGELMMTGRKVQTFLKDMDKEKSKRIIDLQQTILTGGWQTRLRERVSILQELLTEVHKCAECNVYKMPDTYRTKKDRTLFVSLKCPKCHKYTSTTFGRGTKTILHRNLKKTRSC